MSAARTGGVAIGRVSAKPTRSSSAISIDPTWPKSCGLHSLMREILDAHQPEGKEERLDPIRIYERAGDGGDAEQRPRA